MSLIRAKVILVVLVPALLFSVLLLLHLEDEDSVNNSWVIYPSESARSPTVHNFICFFGIEDTQKVNIIRELKRESVLGQAPTIEVYSCEDLKGLRNDTSQLWTVGIFIVSSDCLLHGVRSDISNIYYSFQTFSNRLRALFSAYGCKVMPNSISHPIVNKRCLVVMLSFQLPHTAGSDYIAIYRHLLHTYLNEEMGFIVHERNYWRNGIGVALKASLAQPLAGLHKETVPISDLCNRLLNSRK